ncbi:MAG TPA: sigma-70 family RNA polymerase sigma factor [Actinomycetota bacterium]|nr:sigma-70 family RNA polymerase sigma factor [Actinomycetota bacterium]
MTRPAPPGEHDFDSLFRDHASGVFRTMYAFTAGRRDLAEEATAEAFARALAHAERIRDPLPWIYRTAFRIATDELRRERRTPPDPAWAEQVPAGLGELIDALRRLSPHQRAAIVLRYEADLPVSEIASRMGTSAASVRVHLHRGRNRLRELLGTEETDDA